MNNAHMFAVPHTMSKRRNFIYFLATFIVGFLVLSIVTPVAMAATLADELDFAVDANGKLTGLSEEGKKKAKKDTANALVLPHSVNGKPVNGIADNAFSRLKVTDVDFSQATELKEVGDSAFRDNKISSVTWGDNVSTIGKGAFVNNKLSGTLTLPASVSKVEQEAFRANRISEVKLGDKVSVFGDNVLADNDSWVKVSFADGSETARAVKTTEYDSGYGHVVNPVVVTVRMVDADSGKELTSERVYGKDLSNKGQFFGLGQEAELKAPQISGYEVVSANPVVFTPDSTDYTVEVKYRKVNHEPTIDTGDGKSFPANATVGKAELLKGVTAKDHQGNDITDRITVNPERIDSSVSGTKDVFYTVTDKDGNSTTVKSPVAVGIDWPKVEIGGGWTVGDFTYDGNALTGFSASGKEKLNNGNTELYIPKVNTDGEKVTSIGNGAFRSWQITAIAGDWGEVTSIGEEAFSDNQLTSIPDSWGKVTSIETAAFASNQLASVPDDWGDVTNIEYGAFNSNQLTAIPDDWGEVTSIGNETFSYNPLTTLPDSWGEVISIGDSAFFRNKLSAIPDDWGNVNSIGVRAFSDNQLTTLPDSWGEVTEIKYGTFQYNNITSIPDNWGKVTKIGPSPFYRNKITSIPDDWGEVTSIGNSAFNSLNLTAIPDNWGKVTSIDNHVFSGNKLTSIPDDWGEVTSIGAGAFQDNQLTTLPNNWGKVTSIGSSAFESNQLTTLPDNWGKVTNIDGSAFKGNQLTAIPDSWGEVTKIAYGAFLNNQLTNLPDNWGKVTYIGNNAFANNEITSIPDTVDNLREVVRAARGNVLSGNPYKKSSSHSFYLPDDKLTDSVVTNVIALLKPNGVAYVYTDNRTNPNGVVPKDPKIIINPLEVNVHHVDADSGESLSETHKEAIPKSDIVDNDGNIVDKNLVADLGIQYKLVDSDLRVDSPDVNFDEKSGKIDITYKYKKRSEKELRNLQKARVGIREISNEKYDLSKSDTQLMTGEISIDSSGFSGMSLPSGVKVRLYYSDDVFNEVLVDGKKATKKNGYFEFVYPDMKNLSGSMLSEPFRTYFKENVTPREVPKTMYAEVYNNANDELIGSSLIDGDKVDGFKKEATFTATYPDPNLHVAPQGDVQDFTSRYSDEQEYKDTQFVTEEKGGNKVVHNIVHNYDSLRDEVLDMNRFIDDYTVTVSLPRYAVSLHSSAHAALEKEGKLDSDGYALAEFFAEENPGWVDNHNGTVTFNGNAHRDNIVNSTPLVLHYPGAEEDRYYTINANGEYTPYNKPDKEPVLKSNTVSRFRFVPREVPPNGDILRKLAVERYFYDNAHDRHTEKSWKLLYHAPVDFNNLVIADKNLDDRLYYSGIDIRAQESGKVMLYDKDGATLLTKEFSDGGIVSLEGEISDKQLKDEASYLEVKFNDTVTKGKSGVVYVHTKFKEPNKSVYTETDLGETNRDNPNRFENTMTLRADERSEVSDYDHMVVKSRNAQIRATKTSNYKNENVVGDNGSYFVGFTTSRGAGEDIKDLRLVDVLPEGMELRGYTLNDKFKSIPGARSYHVNNYKNTGKTAVIFEVPNVDYDDYTPGSNYTVGTIDTTPGLLAWRGKQENEAFLQVNEDIFSIENPVTKTDYPYLDEGNWSRANNYMMLTPGSFTKQEKSIRTYSENDNGESVASAWSDEALTYPGQKFDYRLRVINGTDNERKGLRIYDVLPFVGDRSLPIEESQVQSRESEFSNTVDVQRINDNGAQVLNSHGQPIDGLKVQYYNSDNPVGEYNYDNANEVLSALNWSDTPAANTKAVRVVPEDGADVTTPKRDAVSVIIPMQANNKLAQSEDGQDIPGTPHADVAEKKAYNTFYYGFEGEKLAEGNRVYNKMINRPISVEFTKKALPRSLNAVVDNDNMDKLEPLQGARFEYRRADDTVVSAVESDENGTVRFTNIAPLEGDKIVEASTPTGYKTSEEIREITRETIINARNDNNVAQLNDFINELVVVPPVVPKGDVEFTKHDAKGNPLPGAVFQLSRTVGSEKQVFEARANQDGVVKFRNIPADQGGKYTLEETSAPGHLQPIEPREVVVTEDETTDEGTIVNDKVKLGVVKLGVRDNKLVDSEGNAKQFGDFQKIDGTQLAGAKLNVMDVKTGATVSTVTSTESGEVYASGLKTDTLYEIQETTVPSGYKKVDNLPMRFMVNERGALVKENGEKMFIQSILYVPNLETEKTSKVTVTKKDRSGDTVIPGATFELLKKVGDKWVSQTTKDTDSNGSITWDNVESGAYRVRETKASVGYYNEGFVKEFTVDKYTSRDIAIPVTNAKLNPSIKKVDYISRGLPNKVAAQEVIHNLRLSNAEIVRDGNTYDVVIPLKGAKFDLLNGNDDNASILEQLETDDNGNAKITTPLEENGVYYLRETQAPDNYNPLAEPVRFSPRDYTALQGFNGNMEVRVANSRDYGRLVISKTDAETNKLLTGGMATFDVIPVEKSDAPADYTHNGINYKVKDNARVRTVYTDDRNALAVVDKLEFGSYIVKETKAPRGYEVDETPRYFEVSAEESSQTLIQPNREKFEPTTFPLPSTGQAGIIGLVFIAGIAAVGAIALTTRRRKE